MLRLLRATRSAVLFRPFSSAADTRAKLEQDRYDNPYMDTEQTQPSHRIMMPVDPFPRRKLKELYMIALEKFKDLPATAGYRIVMEELTRYRLKVVEDNEDIQKIEQIVGYGNIDDLIEAAKNELVCCDHMKKEKPWEPRAVRYDMYGEFGADSLFGETPFEATQERPKK